MPSPAPPPSWRLASFFAVATLALSCLHTNTDGTVYIEPTSATVVVGAQLALTISWFNCGSSSPGRPHWSVTGGGHMAADITPVVKSSSGHYSSTNTFVADGPPGQYFVEATSVDCGGSGLSAPVRVEAGDGGPPPDAGTDAGPAPDAGSDGGCSGPAGTSNLVYNLIYFGEHLATTSSGDVYWADHGNFPTAGAPEVRVMRAPIAVNATAVELVTSTSDPRIGVGPLTATGDGVMWIDSSNVWRIASTAVNGQATLVVHDPNLVVPRGIAWDGAHVYYCDLSGAISSNTGPGGTPAVIYQSPDTVTGLALDPVYPGNLYVLSGSTVMAMKTDGTARRTVYTDLTSALSSLAIDGDGKQLYWVNDNARALHRVGTDGTGYAELYVAPLGFGIHGVALKGTSVYVTIFDTSNVGKVVRVGKDGSCPTVLAEQLNLPGAIATESGQVVWMNEGHSVAGSVGFTAP